MYYYVWDYVYVLYSSHGEPLNVKWYFRPYKYIIFWKCQWFPVINPLTRGNAGIFSCVFSGIQEELISPDKSETHRSRSNDTKNGNGNGNAHL